MSAKTTDADSNGRDGSLADITSKVWHARGLSLSRAMSVERAAIQSVPSRSPPGEVAVLAGGLALLLCYGFACAWRSPTVLASSDWADVATSRALGVYVAAWSAFHLLEYFVTATYNPASVSVDCASSPALPRIAARRPRRADRDGGQRSCSTTGASTIWRTRSPSSSMPPPVAGVGPSWRARVRGRLPSVSRSWRWRSACARRR